MLTEREKRGIKSILKTLTQEQLTSLATTVSKAQIYTNSDAEREKVILSFEKNAEDFLHRRVISKKILTLYAYKENLQKISDCRSKEDVMGLILKHWSRPDMPDNPLPARKTTHVQVRSAPTTTHSQAWSAPTTTQSPAPTQTINNNYNFYEVNVTVQSNSFTPESQHNNNSLGPSSEDFEFGQTFCNWFFGMLNHSDPVSKGFGPSHFMPQAELFTHFISPGNTSGDRYTNNNAISNVFLDLSKSFTFNPNATKEGIRVKSDPHGLKLILVCGTLFKNMSFCGTFQQSFGLVKDPSAIGNWKIQVTALKCEELKNPVLPVLDESVEYLENSTVKRLQKSLQL